MKKWHMTAIALAILLAASPLAAFGQQSSTNLEGYTFKIFRVESGLYPFVQVYFRSFDQEMLPLVNLNYANLGVMVKGRSYDPAKKQYFVQSIRNRSEAVRTVLVIDCSATMKGQPFENALLVASRFIDSKRPQDQVAVIAIRDTDEGYQIVSNFERDPTALARRLADLKPDGQITRMYDAVGHAMQMCGIVSQGGIGSDDAEYIISNSIVLIADGKNEQSALTREELNTRISNLAIPIPIYSIPYTTVERTHLRNLEALSKNSFGRYFTESMAKDNPQRIVEDIQNILQNDYVVTFRSHVDIDGEAHAFRIGLEYPSNTGKFMFQSGNFDAIEPPPIGQIHELVEMLNGKIPAPADGNPFLSGP
jgi:Mg-chelatase subunit ChlD